jgi:hypothetical protein
MPPEQNEGRPRGRRPFFWATVVASTLAFLYAISGGPAVYLAIKCAPYSRDIEPLYRIYSVVYTPHGWVMSRSESYYNYVMWWGVLANPQIDPPKWRQMKEAEEK